VRRLVSTGTVLHARASTALTRATVDQLCTGCTVATTSGGYHLLPSPARLSNYCTSQEGPPIRAHILYLELSSHFTPVY